MTIKKPCLSALVRGDIIWIVYQINNPDLIVPRSIIKRADKEEYKSTKYGALALKVVSTGMREIECSSELNPGLAITINENDMFYKDYSLAENKILLLETYENEESSQSEQQKEELNVDQLKEQLLQFSEELQNIFSEETISKIGNIFNSFKKE